MDCEPCAEDIDTIFQAWAGLTPNPGRGLDTGNGTRRPYVFLTAETYTLPQLQATTTLDFLQIMDSNYTAGPNQMLANLQDVRQQWATTHPDVPILLGVKPGVTSLSTLSQALQDSTTAAWQQESPFGWVLFNVSRDAGCLTGASADACNPPSQEIIDQYPALASCTAYGQFGLTSPPDASYSLLDCLTAFLESGSTSACSST